MLEFHAGLEHLAASVPKFTLRGPKTRSLERPPVPGREHLWRQKPLFSLRGRNRFFRYLEKAVSSKAFAFNSLRYGFW
jgi:hypothetical protein